MCHSPVLFIHRSINYHWRCTGRTHTVLQIQQSACKPRLDTSYCISSEEQRGNQSLKVEWNRTNLENTPHPKYLGVTLDHTLGYKEHMHNIEMKVATRNNILRKLSNSKWGANASIIRTTALALCYSVAEYAVPVWARSSHAQKLNPELSSACRASQDA